MERPQPTIGEKLYGYRTQVGMDLEYLSKKILISKKHLEAIEENRLNDIPFAPVYQKNFVRKFAEAVDAPVEDILSQFSAERKTPETLSIGRLTADRGTRLPSYNIPTLIKGTMIALIVMTLVGYLVSQVNAMVAPPELELFSPSNGLITAEALLTISGKTADEATVSINGQEITTDTTGHFSEVVVLSGGVNTITVTSKTKHGKETTVTRHITLTP